MTGMLDTLRDLVAHKGYANAALLCVTQQNAAAAADAELSELLHHILLANRFWLVKVLDLPFHIEHEARPFGSSDDMVQRYAETQDQESAWLAAATDGDLDRIVEEPRIPGGRCSVAQAFLQVCLHSHGHRAQAAKLLRRHEVVPPTLDFILWLASRPAAAWPGTASTPTPAA
jgi:uncharacterized damage-inducible protein DinB